MSSPKTAVAKRAHAAPAAKKAQTAPAVKPVVVVHEVAVPAAEQATVPLAVLRATTTS